MKNLFVLFLFIIGVGAYDSAHAQKYPGLDASPADVAYLRTEGRGGDVVIRVVYGRPSKKNRTMLGGKEPYGQVWRTGANESTEIKLYRDVTFADTKVPAGTYTLYSIPNEDKWVIILNSKLDTWGAYNYDESKDVARITVPAGKTDKEIEAFTIEFEGDSNTGKMFLAWENTLVTIPLKY